jgi:hypothetical protein
MGYPVPLNNPTFTNNGTTYCVAAFNWDNPIGQMYYCGVFIRMADGSWNSPMVAGNGVVVQYINPGECLADVQAKGGKVKYLQWLLAKINEVLAKMFKGAVTPPATEPTTDAEAKAIIGAYVLGLKISTTTPPAAQ